MPRPDTIDASHQRSRRLLASVLAGAGSVVAVVAVAVLAAGSSDDGSRMSTRPVDPRTLLDILFAAMLAYAVVVMVLLVIGVVGGRSGDGRSAPGPRWLAMIQGMFLMGAVMWLWLSRRLDQGEVVIEPVDIVFDSPETVEAVTVDPAGSPSWVWMLTVALVVAAGVIGWWTTRGLRQPPPALPGDDDSRLESVIDLFDTAIDDLRTHPDPRAAVIATFARLQAGLAGAGIRRELADTPSRYLRRVLQHVEVSAPAAERLTDAYELAQYSHHEVSRDTQLSAVDALVAVRDELRSTSRRRLVAARSRADAAGRHDGDSIA